jgi:MFS family permease
LSRADSVIQFYGQFLSLGIGFLILATLNGALGWRWMFLLVGLAGIVVARPMFLFLLHGSPDEIMAGATRAERRALARTRAAHRAAERQAAREAAKNRERINRVLRRPAIRPRDHCLLHAGHGSAHDHQRPHRQAGPDRVRRSPRLRYALLLLLAVHGFVGQIVLISIVVGVLYGSFSPNICSIVQALVRPNAVGPAAVIGSASLITYGRRVARTRGQAPGQTPESELPQSSPSGAGA